MGRQKLFIKTGGVPLFDRVYSVVGRLFKDIIVVSNQPEWFRSYDLQVIPDMLPGRGALGGLYTGLKCAPSGPSFCFAADMPFLNPGLIRYIMARGTTGDVVIPRTSDGLQPLHAVYSKRCLKPIENLFSKGNLKIIDFYREVAVVYISEREVRKYDPTLDSFLNVNTEKDLRRAEAILKTGFQTDSK
jgi:molybdopterin-guanine dinucleotide biosynthesis protein A